MPMPLRSALAALLVLASTASAQTDPRVGLRAGLDDAGQAIHNLTLVAHVARPEGFVNPADPGDFGFANTDLAFRGDLMLMGNYHGVQMYDISNPAAPRLRATLTCPGGQGDVSIHGDLLFMSVEETRGRVDCGLQGVEAPVSAERFRGVRVFDVSDVEHPRQVAAVQTCRGSHTHTLVPDPTRPGQPLRLRLGHEPRPLGRGARRLLARVATTPTRRSSASRSSASRSRTLSRRPSSRRRAS